MAGTAVPFTKQIKDGVLRLSEMELEHKLSGTVTSVNPEGTKYGPTFKVKLKTGAEVEILPSGNAKFFAKDLVSGRRSLNTYVSITRKPNKTFNGRSTTQFAIWQEGHNKKADTDGSTTTSGTTDGGTDTTAAAATAGTTNLEDVRAALKG